MPLPLAIDRFRHRLADDRSDAAARAGLVRWLEANAPVQAALAHAHAAAAALPEGSPARVSANAEVADRHTKLVEHVRRSLGLPEDAELSQVGGLLVEGYFSDVSETRMAHVLSLLEAVPTISELHLSSLPRLSDSGLSALADAPQIRELWAGFNTQLSGRFVEALAAADHPLRSLHLAHCELELAVVPAALSLRLLEELLLVGNRAACADLSGLRDNSSLRLLGLQVDGMGAGELSVLAGLPLVTLDLSGAGSIGEAGMALLGRMPALRNLLLRGARLTAAGVASLGEKLSSVWLSSSPMDAATAAGFARHQGLKKLRIQYDAALGSGWMAAFAGHPALEELDLSLCAGLQDRDGVHLGMIPNLKEVGLSHCGAMGDQTVRALAKVPTLKRLDLSGTAITAAVIPLLATMPALQHLMLNSCALKPTDLAPLASSPSLKYLFLSTDLAAGCPTMPAKVSA